MQLKLNTSRSSNILKIVKLFSKVALPLVVFFVVIYFVGQLQTPSPNKIINFKIPNEKLKIVK